MTHCHICTLPIVTHAHDSGLQLRWAWAALHRAWLPHLGPTLALTVSFVLFCCFASFSLFWHLCCELLQHNWYEAPDSLRSAICCLALSSVSLSPHLVLLRYLSASPMPFVTEYGERESVCLSPLIRQQPCKLRDTTSISCANND